MIRSLEKDTEGILRKPGAQSVTLDCDMLCNAASSHNI